MATALMGRMETTTSVASSLDQLHPRSKDKAKQKSKDTNDPLRVLDPARKKLSSVEAQRVLAVLDETIRRAEIVTLLPYVIENIERFSVLLGSELVRLLENHDQLQAAYQKAVSKYELEIRKSLSASPCPSESTASSSRRSSTASGEGTDLITSEGADSRTSSAGKKSLILQKNRRMSSDSKHSLDSDRVVDALQTQLAHSARNILRVFSNNPSAVNAIKDERSGRSFESNKLVNELTTMRAIVFERLLTTPNEEKERKHYLKEVVARERKSSVLASKLQAELEYALSDKENEISKRNDIIRRLKNNIFNVEKGAEDQNHRIIAEAARLEAGELKSSDGKRAKLQQEIIELKKTLESETQAHRESEYSLRKRKYKIETEVENWIQKFDSDMGDRQDEFNALDAVYTEEKKQLQELEERFKTLKKEYLQIIEERRIAKEKAEAAQRELNIKIRAAKLIQNLWRSHRARNLLKKKGKKKGKKGKKGKKNGGKKK